ncbi:MAG TPA: methionyl-tRNA formyltransferase [Candidatus Paceibacterota bacterium]
MIQDLGFKNKLEFIFLGSSRFSEFVLRELEEADFSPILKITDAKAPLPEKIEADFFVVASFGKILPKEFIEMPRLGSLNVHPSLLPKLRGPSPIQNLILGNGTPGVSIIKMDEKMDHGPIVAQEEVTIDPWPDHYETVEEKLARAGGKLLVQLLSKAEPWTLQPQDEPEATYIKFVKKEDGFINLADSPEENLHKVLAYSTWPGAWIFFKRKTGEEIRVVIKDAKIEGDKFMPTRIIPEGKREMDWQDFLRGNA